MKHAPFALVEGYPFLAPVSIENYPTADRIGDIMHIENKVINMNKPLMENKLGLEPGVDQATFDRAFYLGFTDRLLVAEHALAEAENQIIDMMKDMPFIPENFCFEKAVWPAETTDSPVTIYKSKLISGVLLSKVPGENNTWVIMRDGIKTNYLFTSERVAVCVFYALGITIVNPQKDADVVVHTESAPSV